MGRIGVMFDGLKPMIMMVVVQISMAGLNVFLKLAAANGMNIRIFLAYRFIIAALFMVPLSLVLERKKRPKLTWMIICQTFFCGLFGGSLAQNLYAQSLLMTSATFAAAMANLVPALTFILALCFGMEQLRLRKAAGWAKMMGTVICLGGAMLLTFYKGREVNILSTNVDLLKMFSSPDSHINSGSGKHNIVWGALVALACGCSCAVTYVLQAKLMKNYPCPYSSTALIMIFGSLQAFVFAVAMERNWSQWKLGWNIRLLSVSYSGIVASGLTFTLIGWCVQMRGPLYVSVFSPLLLVLVAVAGCLFLDEKLHIGSILGAVVIVAGLYLVLWGKGQEMKRYSKLTPSKSFKESNRFEQLEVIGLDHKLPMPAQIDDELDDDINMNNQAIVGLGVDICTPILVEVDDDDIDENMELPIKRTTGM